MSHDRVTANALLDALRGELSAVEQSIRSHHLLEALAAGRVPHDRLRAFAGEQYAIVSSDRRSFAFLAGRFPEPPAGDLFLNLAAGEGQALARLLDFAAWLALDEAALRSHEPNPQAQVYPAFVAWLALNGSRADVALAFLANLAAWGANCGGVARALRERYGAGEADLAFFAFFAEPPPGLEDRMLAVLQSGLDAGDTAIRARRCARLLQSYELLFWDSVAQGIV
ncbi:hypothetical protein GCM10023094_03970 [Rhodococcus olei]|uniref:Thiaminase-2/PQQC domain-containing protein n=1 Tax=Rhodococcus olei TaxID=2161675 RepID=A0ABP8NVX7_9NOCA